MLGFADLAAREAQRKVQPTFRRVIRNTLKFLATGTLSLLIAACYGVAMLWNMKRVTAVSPAGTGIEGLSVTLRIAGQPPSTEFTDDRGIVDFTFRGSFAGATIDVKDLDGPANGGTFQEATVVLDDSPDTIVAMKDE